MMRIVFLPALLLLATGVHAQTYTPSPISKDLLNRASAVVLNDDVSIEVKDLGSVIYREKKTVTVFNKNGDTHAALSIYYDKNLQIRSVKGIIYNEFGLPAGKFAEKDMTDVSAVDDNTFYDDARVKYYHPAAISYPYTIEIEYETRSKQTLSFPTWQPGGGYNVSVARSSYSFKCSPGFEIRYLERNFPGKVAVTTDKDGLKSYLWTVTNINALRAEPYSPPSENFLTSVDVAPVKFSYESVDGSFTNWSEYGAWTNEKLLKNRNQIPAETSAKILELTKDIADPKEKAKKIYEFMQQKTRYIGVQVGIGGFRPFPASEVDKLSYGDCKGLVNYTQGLLAVAGIKSYYTVVQAGDEKSNVPVNFANMNFGNHIILCVPFERDTTWLECTSKDIPFGFLGEFTDDRSVVVCTEKGGVIMHTPRYDTQQNMHLRKSSYKIDSLGNATGEINGRYDGLQYDNRASLVKLTYTEQLKKIPELYTIPNIEVSLFKLNPEKRTNPSITEQLKFYSRNYGAMDGNRMNIPLNEINRLDAPLKEIRNRVLPVAIDRSFSNIDEASFQLPAGYKLDAYPESIEVNKPFGKFSLNISVTNNVVTCVRKLQLVEGTYAAESYQELVDFYQVIFKADAGKIGLVKL